MAESTVTEDVLPELPAETEIPQMGALSVSDQGKLMQVMDKILTRLDADSQDQKALEMFERVLAMHGEVLRQTSPVKQNERSHGISYLNPKGERDHPRARLVRPAVFLGVPLNRDHLRDVEIDLLNQISASCEVPAPNGRGMWSARVLRDQGGGELLYISVPFTGHDDLRGLSLVSVLEALTGRGKAVIEENSYASRIEALLQANEAMAGRLAALEQHLSHQVQ